MIEYDKANVTSSYPSLTEYEVATILDKAYLALIARKLTGNNTRRVPFEYDTKAIEDLRPLVVSNTAASTTATTMADNELAFKLPTDMLYYLEGQASYNDAQNPADEKSHSNEIITLVDHRTAQKFRSTNTNMPWIKQPVSFLQDDDVYVLYDTYKHRNPFNMLVTYIKKPASFVANLGSSGSQGSGSGGSGGNSGGDEPTQPTGQLSISIHRNDFQDDTKALIVATIVVENIEDQLYVDIFEKAETASEWTLLNTDTYDNNHTISWPVDITTYNKNVKFVIRNSDNTIKKESNVFTITSTTSTTPWTIKVIKFSLNIYNENNYAIYKAIAIKNDQTSTCSITIDNEESFAVMKMTDGEYKILVRNTVTQKTSAHVTITCDADHSVKTVYAISGRWYSSQDDTIDPSVTVTVTDVGDGRTYKARANYRLPNNQYQIRWFKRYYPNDIPIYLVELQWPVSGIGSIEYPYAIQREDRPFQVIARIYEDTQKQFNYFMVESPVDSSHWVQKKDN